jgi:hypothetical protein
VVVIESRRRLQEGQGKYLKARLSSVRNAPGKSSGALPVAREGFPHCASTYSYSFFQFGLRFSAKAREQGSMMRSAPQARVAHVRMSRLSVARRESALNSGFTLGPNGRSEFANQRFSPRIVRHRRKVIFSATTYLQMRPLGRAFR